MRKFVWHGQMACGRVVSSPRRLVTRVLSGLALLLITAMMFAPPAEVKTTAQKTEFAYAIKGAQLVTVTGQVIPAGNIVIRNGLITAVGAEAAIPADARVIDGKGLTVYPGLIDAYTSLGFPEPQRPQAPGSGGASSLAAQLASAQQSDPQAGKRPERLATDELKATESLFENARNAGITTALTVQRDGVFQGQSALINLAGASPEDMVLKSPVALHVSFSGVRGFGFGGYPGSLMGMIAFVRQGLLDAQQYQQATAHYEKVKRGVRRPDNDESVETLSNKSLAALQPVINRALPVVITADREREVRRALRLAEEFNLKSIVLGGAEAGQVAGLLKEKQVPVLLSLNFPKPRTGPDANEPEDSLDTLRERATAPKNPAALAKAGVKFAFYSGGLTNLRDMFANISLAIEQGLAPAEAIKALTIYPAEIFGVSEQLGSLEVGKIANLVVTSGDLFAKDTRVRHLFIDGREIELRKEPATPQRAAGPQTGRPGREASAIAGNWELTVALPSGSPTMTATLRQAGPQISGSISGPMGQTELTDGKLSDNQLSFSVTFNFNNRSFTATFLGTVEGDTMTGKVNMPMGEFNFTGRRQPSPMAENFGR